MASESNYSREVSEYLNSRGLIDNVYDSLNNEDYSEGVLLAMEALIKSGKMLHVERYCKNEDCAKRNCGMGDFMVETGEYRSALEIYNSAIAHAPEGSFAMKIAYNNRCKLFRTIGAYTACIKDIETCLSLGVNSKETKQLLKLKKYCERKITPETKTSVLNFKVKGNPEIPCADTNIGFVKRGEGVTVVAAKDIQVGTVIAVEKAYVASLAERNQYIACYYCHKLDLNLIPCDKCFNVMFCSEKCKQNCKKEFHNIECQIIGCYIPLEIVFQIGYDMSVKAAIKMRQSCSSWKEFNEASKNIGPTRKKDSSVKEIYDRKHEFSLLSMDTTSAFSHGKLFNSYFTSAVIIHYLMKVPSFFPETKEEQDAAVRSFARVMTNLYLFYPAVCISNCAETIDHRTCGAEDNMGWFSFTGKLNHSCDANLLVLGLNDTVALTAIKSIKKGEELTISFIGHYYNDPHINERGSFRAFALYSSKKITCNCQVCAEEWSSKNLKSCEMTVDQIRGLENLGMMSMFGDGARLKTACARLTRLQSVPCTRFHHCVYWEFRVLAARSQSIYTGNVIIPEGEDYAVIIPPEFLNRY